MSLAQAVSLNDAQIEGLLSAYLERKKVEAKILLSVVGEAFKPKQPEMTLGGLAAMGFKIEGA
jgi:hypothetical protein